MYGPPAKPFLAFFRGLEHQLDEALAAGDGALAVDMGDVRLHRAVRQVELLADVSARTSLDDHGENLRLTRGEAVLIDEPVAGKADGRVEGVFGRSLICRSHCGLLAIGPGLGDGGRAF